MWGIAQFCLLYLRCMWELMWPIRGERSAWECQSGCWWGMIPAWLSWHRRDTELSHERAKCRKKDSTGQYWEARSRNCNAGCRISLWEKTEIPDLAAASISGLTYLSGCCSAELCSPYIIDHPKTESVCLHEVGASWHCHWKGLAVVSPTVSQDFLD